MKGYYVYRFLNKNNSIIYIGRTDNLNRRMNYEHFTKKGHLTQKCYEQTTSIEFLSLCSESEMKIYELFLINKYDPIYNIKDKNKDHFSFELPEMKWEKYSKFLGYKQKQYLTLEINMDFLTNTMKLLEKYKLNKIIEYINQKNESFGINEISEVTNESKTILNLKLNLLVLLGVIEKTNHRVRCYIKPTSYNREDVENISLIFLNKNLNLKDINYNRINELFGEDIANKMYPLLNKQQIAALPYIDQVIKYTESILNKFGWVTEIKIKEYLHKLDGVKISHFKRYIDYLIKELEIHRAICTKKIKQSLNINKDKIPLESFPIVLLKS